jgi:hypothetical protein
MNQQAMQVAAQAAIDATIHEYAIVAAIICFSFRLIQFLFDRDR